MALDSVVKDIIEDAEAKASSLRKEGEEEAAKLLAKAEETVSEMKKKEDKRLEESIARLQRQELSSAELESKKIVLSKKKEILDRSFMETLAELESSDAKTKKKYYRMMVDSVKGIIENPRVRCAPGEAKNLKGLEVSDVVEDRSISGGLIFESADGEVRIDMQFETILRNVWDREMKTISDILFG